MSDIKHHSGMDNYLFKLHKRAILQQEKQKHNSKGLEKNVCRTRSNERFP